ncbi:WYL domain-containing protein [Shewanella algae]|uniref:WYL domain-containing protein n=1 Tax=Shewanella algae TaxID=38313 RepID=UPI0013C349DC|nr:WYL domain-containing protein [Shewanella algae]QXP18781.1 WYL domain-containing protein [Shewanella algae]QXP28342.1 WYL domain-containing protein [Shewanella algae]QXP34648.1 WYL domain-containing protein [Shewanella algae]QXP37536.1 WYL domain-containing protein [Shewanella algae]
MQHAQRERLIFIDYSLEFYGKVSRISLVNKFGIGVASCSRDLKLYLQLAPDNTIFRHSDKHYYRSDNFKPLFLHDISAVFNSFDQVLGDSLGCSKLGANWTFNVPSIALPKNAVISSFSRSIVLRKAVRLGYLSMNHGLSLRTFCPHAIVNTGSSWIVRGYDLQTQGFLDFVCSRIEHASVTPIDVPQEASVCLDVHWQNVLTLDLVPHPGLKFPASVELEFGMRSGRHTVEIRAALANYVLDFLKVDCTANAKLNPTRHRLWLSNQSVIQQIVNLNSDLVD